MLTPGRPGWWPGVSVVDADAGLVCGAEYSIRVRSPFGYRLAVRLRVTELDPPHAIAAVSVGDLVGRGRMELRASPTGTTARIEWTAHLERAWMVRVAPVLRPVFVAAHTLVMRRGERAARRRLQRG